MRLLVIFQLIWALAAVAVSMSDMRVVADSTSPAAPDGEIKCTCSPCGSPCSNPISPPPPPPLPSPSPPPPPPVVPPPQAPPNPSSTPYCPPPPGKVTPSHPSPPYSILGPPGDLYPVDPRYRPSGAGGKSVGVAWWVLAAALMWM